MSVITKWMVAVAVLAAALNAVEIDGASAATLVVDDDGHAIDTDCSDTTTAYTTIQAAVTSAASGDAIFICPGTYAEQVEIATSDLMIAGDDQASVIVRPTSLTTNATSLATGFPIDAIFLVDAAVGVSISSLTVDGSGATLPGCSPNYIGIYYRASSGTINDVRVTNMRPGPGLDGCQTGLGIFVQSGNGGPDFNASVTITSSKVEQYSKNGITANEPGTTVTITDNKVFGRGPVGLGDAAQNGIQIGFGARGMVDGNEVKDHDYTPPDFVACGVLMFEGGGGLGRTKNNIYSGNEQNLCTAGAGSPPFSGTP